MRREYLLVAAASAVALCMIISGAEAVPTKQAGSFVASGMISGGKTEDDGSSWIRLWSEDSRYVVGSSDKGRRDELWRLLHAAHGSNHAISARYDAGAGRINSTAKTLDYPVCTITFGDIQFASSRACDTKSLSTSPETALALGFAHAQDGGAKTARELLDEALAKGPRDIIFRAIALRARADALSMIALANLREAYPPTRPASPRSKTIAPSLKLRRPTAKFSSPLAGRLRILEIMPLLPRSSRPSLSATRTKTSG